jgi:hypothetical protein
MAASLPPLPPTFDRSIAGTGVVSHLAMLNGPAAQEVVWGYLNNNALVRAMPLCHSLAYFCQILLLGHHHHMGGGGDDGAAPTRKHGWDGEECGNGDGKGDVSKGAMGNDNNEGKANKC